MKVRVVLNKAPLIDLDKRAQKLYQQLGVETSKLLFNYLAPGEHPNYPNGKADNTHFNELGARKIAEMVLADIRTLLPGLSERMVKKKIINTKIQPTRNTIKQ
jgi:hypothetical protein